MMTAFLNRLPLRVKDTLFLLFFTICCAMYSLWAGQDVNWDILNYHLYIPYAFLNGRFLTDVMPAGIHTFLNPLLDVPYYWMVLYLNNYPKLIAFLQGCWGGVLIWIVYKTCLLFLQEKEGKMQAGLAAMIGLTGSMTLSQIGLATNEIPMAILLVSSFYLLMKFFFSSSSRSFVLLFCSAFIAGAAGGLKYTGFPFVIALTAVFFVNLYWTEKRWKSFLIFAGAGILGFLVTDGYFLWRLWSEYQNPVFPFYNEIFHSPYFENINFADERFFPRNMAQWLFYPFYWIFESRWIVSEIEMSDGRMALGYIAFFVLLFALPFKRIPLRYNRRKILSLLVYLGVGYLVWLPTFSILRYVVTIEVLCGILIIAAIRNFAQYRVAALMGTLIALNLWYTTQAPNWGRDAFSEKAVLVEPLPKVEDNAMVVYFGQPMSFMSMFFPKDCRFVGGITFPVDKYPAENQKKAKQRNSLPSMYYKYRMNDKIKQAISAHQGPIYVMAVPWEMMLSPITLAPYGLQADKEECTAFNANINLYSAGWKLCKVGKLKSSAE